MRMRWGPGPVFAFESLVAARRWQVYAVRAGYVGLLLAGLAMGWGPTARILSRPSDAAALGRVFLLTLIAIQLGVVLLAAPAATAGAICVDKARGTILHAFVTDLTAREIVLGKLGARLIPVLALMACGLPVLALGSFLGGIDLAEALGAELATAGTSVFCCSMALLASVYAREPHQALLLSYLVVGLWVGLVPALLALFMMGPPMTVEAWILDLSNPILAAFAPEVFPPGGTVGLREQSAFLLVTLLLSWGLVAWRAIVCDRRSWRRRTGRRSASRPAHRRGSSITCPDPRSTPTRSSGASGTASARRAGPADSGRPMPTPRCSRASTSSATITPGGATACSGAPSMSWRRWSTPGRWRSACCC